MENDLFCAGNTDHDYNTAIKYYKIAMSDYNFIGIGVFYNISLCYYYKDEYSLSFQYLNEALKHTKDESEIGRIEYVIGNNFEATDEMDEAISHYKLSAQYGYLKAKEVLKEIENSE